MYKQEKVIVGVLHHKDRPDGDWKPYTAEQLTNRLQWTEETLYKVKKELETLKAEVAWDL
jgi:hypothetical protein